jgi:hypothetical protein
MARRRRESWIHRWKAQADPMRRTIYILLALVVVIGAAGVFLSTWDIPPPTERVQKVISNDRFPR